MGWNLGLAMAHADGYFFHFSNYILVIAPLGGMLLAYRPETRKKSLVSSQGRAVYKPITFSYRVHYN